jgi:hypothetical protein
MLRFVLSGLLLLAQTSPPDQPPVFGTTVVSPSGLQGNIYFLRRHNGAQPKVEKKRAKGTIYTTRLNIPPQDFTLGFPGVTDRLEWFAIDYRGKFYVTSPGTFRFRLTSDDGSELYIDGRKIIDNGGLHTPQAKDGTICLATGVHEIRVLYFQGPKYLVALILEVARPGEPSLRIFDTEAFKPPPGDPADWPKPESAPCGS